MIINPYTFPEEWNDSNTDFAPTKVIPSIPVNTTEFPDGYWMGYMNWDVLPYSYHVTRLSYDNGRFTFSDNTKAENVPVAFTFCDSGSAYDNYGLPYITAFNGTKWDGITYDRGSSSFGAARFANNANINCSTRNNLMLYLLGYDGNGNFFYASMTTDIQSFLESETFTASVTFNAGIYGNSLTFTKEDISQYKTFQKTGSEGVTAEWVLGFFKTNDVRDVTKADTGYGYTRPHPTVRVHTIDDKSYLLSCPMPFNFDSDNFSWNSTSHDALGIRVKFDGSLGSYVTRNTYDGETDLFGGFIGTFKDELVMDLSQLFVPDGANFYVRNVSRRDFFFVGRVFTHKEIVVMLSLQPRFSNGISDGSKYAYTINGRYYYYPEIDLETNEFKGSLITAADTSKLATWEKIGSTLNSDAFTEDDIPEYVPPTPSDAENIGDKITRPATLGIGGTNGFVTLYALRKSDIAQLGELLWTSFIDADYWKNYLFSLALDTGTFSLAGLLNFFVSCRVYPFPLKNIAGCTPFGDNMYVGTGIVPLEFTAQTNLHVLSNMVDYISGGYCNVPRYFNDWRDYVNTEIMLYIPYCGTVRLNPGDVIGNKISVQYAVDFATGGCIAYVDMETGDGAGYPVGALPGQIGADIPLTATAAGEVAARFIGDALNVGGIVAGEGASVASGALGAATGKPSAGGSGNVLSGAAGMFGGLPAAMAVDMAVPLAKQGLSMLARGAVQAPMLSGGRGFASFGAPQVPYVQIRRGIYPEISGLLNINGKPAATTTTIGALSGFVQGDVKTDGLPCHENEKAKIRRLIADGIYV